MNKVLKDPDKVKTKVNGQWPWTFNAPTKDVAHSGCLSAGNYYGIGLRQPVGKEKAAGLASGPIPQESKAFSADEIFYGEDQRG
jgi:hypothetical protein